MKIKVLSVFAFLIMILQHGYVLAQESIVQDISEVYVDKLVNVARQNYPRIKTYQSRVDVAKVNVSIASVSLFDALSLSYIYQPDNVTVVDPANPGTRFFKGLQLGVFINLGTILRTPMNIKRAKAERRLAESERDEYTLTLAAEVKRRYYLYIQRVGQLKTQTRAWQEAENGIKDIEYRYKKGEATFETFNTAQIQLTERRTQKIESEANVFISKADLEEILGEKLENIK
ncbi:TolC family protein [Mucilaginibacter sp. UR6-1]|uniref:TolC family protein n=1 Tax=Mucilaginibacter sp. UR6-1 TaxID=1435643 RepID=UPI001E58B738|nr:TolC family protein [Mucilaginibacter sp. UR6-1]MCC8407395.1 TolC family protein [Mucilaginibacter sp. UR6-1]